MRLRPLAQRDGDAAGTRRQAARWTVALLAATAMSGCALTTKPLTLSTAVPGTWASPDAAAGVSVLRENRDVSSWWRQLNDPMLADLVDKALAANLDVRGAQARLRQARARRGLAGKDLLPSVNGSVSGNTGKTSGDSSSPARTLFDAGLDASWEPDIFGGVRQAVNAAQADAEASEADFYSTSVSLAGELAVNYIDLRAYQAKLTIASENLARQTETLQLISWRAQAGLASDLDVEQSRTNVEQTRALIPAIETGIAQAEHRLAILIGQPPAALHEVLSVPAPIPSAPDRVVIGIPADTLRQRPDVRAVERRLAAATARLGEAESARYPAFRLSGSFGVQSVATAGLALAQNVTQSLLAGLTAPIFDRGRIRKQIEIQTAAQEEALASYEQTILTALEDVENAITSLSGTRRRRVSLTAAVQSARNAAQLARDRYIAGLVSYQTVLDTERSVLTVEESLTSTTAEGTSALVRLYKALGGGWTPPQAADTGTHQKSEAL